MWNNAQLKIIKRKPDDKKRERKMILVNGFPDIVMVVGGNLIRSVFIISLVMSDVEIAHNTSHLYIKRMVMKRRYRLK